MRGARGTRCALRGVLLLCALCAVPSAFASDADDLLPALKKARSLAARGEVQVTVLFPPRDVPTRLVGKLPALPLRPTMIVKNFDVLKAGTEVMAGRMVTRYELTPRNAGAARWRLWVDQAWNVPLGFEERGADGSLARQALFQKVNAKPATEKLVVPDIPGGLRGAVLSALPGFRFPAGFAPVGVKQAGQKWEVTLSDGLNALALVTAPRNVKAAPGVASRKVGGRFVWLVGNMPQGALSAAISGVKSIDEAGLGTFLSPDASNP